MSDIIEELDSVLLGRTAPSWANRAKDEIVALRAQLAASADEQNRLNAVAHDQFMQLAGKDAELAQCRQDAEIGAAVNRACEALPARALIEITLEQGAGIVRLFLPDTDAQLDEFEHEADTFGGPINAAIDAAISQSTQQPEQQ